MALCYVKKDEWEGYYEKSYPELVDAIKNIDELVRENKVKIFNAHPNLVAEVEMDLGEEKRRVVVKIFGWRNVLHFIISPFMKSKAQLSLENSLHLLSRGLLTPKPLAAFWERKNGFVKRNFFITESLEECESLREILKKKRENKQNEAPYIKKLAEYVKKMHDSGFFHKDLTLANFLIKSGENSYYLVDLNRARRKKSLFFLERIEDIVRMDLTDEERSIFLEYYTSGKNAKLWKTILKIRRKFKVGGEWLKKKRRRLKTILSFR